MKGRTAAGLGLLLVMTVLSSTAKAWGPQGHRLVALVAARHLTPSAGRAVVLLLNRESLADVSTWADDYVDANFQTYFWHFVDIPLDARAYDRERDCPRQPGVSAGGRGDSWRDCVVDRILYHQRRLADLALDRADRAVALKFLVHLVADLHQPFHAVDYERGGNLIPVSAFGSSNCAANPKTATLPCNLHRVWDTTLIAHRHLSDERYVPAIEALIARERLDERRTGGPADWAIESHDLVRPALVPARGQVDEAYYRGQIGVVDERLALAGVRLASVVNSAFALSGAAR